MAVWHACALTACGLKPSQWWQMSASTRSLAKLKELNDADALEAKCELERCCGSSRWIEQMLAARPFASVDALIALAASVWLGLDRQDWLEAFTHHPKIGDIDSLRAKFASTKQWAQGEQKGVQDASESILNELAQGNTDYEERFGYIFIVCATGKTASEMLTLLKARLQNSPEQEIKIAADEQAKITRLRLEKLLS